MFPAFLVVDGGALFVLIFEERGVGNEKSAADKNMATQKIFQCGREKVWSE